MPSDLIVWDECYLKINVSDFILLSVLKTLEYTRKIKLLLSQENFGEK